MAFFFLPYEFMKILDPNLNNCFVPADLRVKNKYMSYSLRKGANYVETCLYFFQH